MRLTEFQLDQIEKSIANAKRNGMITTPIPSDILEKLLLDYKEIRIKLPTGIDDGDVNDYEKK